jgi:hypothetical protein
MSSSAKMMPPIGVLNAPAIEAPTVCSDTTNVHYGKRHNLETHQLAVKVGCARDIG